MSSLEVASLKESTEGVKDMKKQVVSGFWLAELERILQSAWLTGLFGLDATALRTSFRV